MRRALVVCALFCLAVVASKKYSRQSLKMRCFQCNMPYQCETGFCYGDVCVKTSASDSYVVKGCENVTRSVGADIYEPQLKLKSYCKKEDVLGVEATICYCRDRDFCNSADSRLGSIVLFAILFVLS